MRTNKIHAGANFPALPANNENDEFVDVSKPTGDADWQMVVVYRGRHCPLCTKFLNKLADYRQRLLDIGVDIAAVSADSKAQLREHKSRLEVNFPVKCPSSLATGPVRLSAFLVIQNTPFPA